LLASEDLRQAASGVVFVPGGYADRYAKPLLAEFSQLNAALGNHYKEMPQAVGPLLDAVAKVSREVLVDPKMDAPTRACIEAYLQALRSALSHDPVLVMINGCVKSDPDGSYETLVATMEMVSVRENIVRDRLSAMREELEPLIQKALGGVNLQQTMWMLQKVMANYERQVRLIDETPPQVDLRALGPALDELDKALAHATQVFRRSSLYRICSARPAPPPDVLDAVLRPRFEQVRSVIEKRWERLATFGPIARLTNEKKIPRLRADEARSGLQRLRLVVVDGPAERAHYIPETHTVTVSNGLAAMLCTERFPYIEAALRNDASRVQSARDLSGKEGSFEDLLQTAFAFEGSAALAIAEQMELQLVTALDFLLAHEVAHALFDRGNQPGPLAPRERELRADTFAFVIVDRTSETALIKRIAAISEDEVGPLPGRPAAPQNQRTPAEYAMLATLPGGLALLSIYSGTRFEQGDAEHPPLRDRMGYIHRWMAEPLAGRDAGSYESK
jgi:hypothetical protein